MVIEANGKKKCIESSSSHNWLIFSFYGYEYYGKEWSSPQLFLDIETFFGPIISENISVGNDSQFLPPTVNYQNVMYFL